MDSGRERVAKAFSAMKSLGIPDETTRPVLKKLFKLYDKNWELIEEDNYRTLADAIFEYDDDKLMAEKELDKTNEDSEPPFKKPHGIDRDKVLPTLARGKNILEDGPEIPRKYSGKKMVESSQSMPVDRTCKPRHSASISKCMDIVPFNSCPDEETSYTPRASSAIGPVRKRTNGSAQFEDPTLHIHPGSNVISQHSDERRKHIGSSSEITNPPTMSQTTYYDIASSACGQVKISLTCKLTPSQLNFHFPNAQETLSIARQFCNTEGSHFSLINLLSEFCENYLETISEPDKRSHINKTFPRNHTHITLEGRKASSSKKRAIRKISDITNGTEKVKISLLDETGGEDWPHFVYCPENITYESAYVHISLARISEDDCCLDCRGDCLSSKISCPCARETGGEFAYTQEGLLSEKFLSTCISIKLSEDKQPPFYCQDCPLERAKNGNTQEDCKGHRVRKFIKECWRKCGCKMDCGNRVVQRGISRKLQVFLTSGGKGWGLRPLEEIPKGAFICEYVGEILTNMELYERNTKTNNDGKHAYPVLLDADWATEGVLKDEEALCLDATNFGNVARFINHRCFDGNLIEVPVQVETPDRHYYHLAFFTKKKVDALEELTWDYEIDFEDNSHPVDAFRCLCGSEYCRDRRRGKE
ncbi:hypothetical protein CASFOL_006190 [Castilleja foliolosa]|uniref:Uncharacterized protein n=1 Tax=Castilleja foliolosa TaxID=1961234 RepID=A0ABD3E6K2_9LAMI